MKFSYSMFNMSVVRIIELLFFAVFTLLLSVAVSEESIEVTVDNTPKPVDSDL